MAVVGSAEIIVRAITNKVKSDIERAFRDARPTIQKEGRAAAKDYAGAFGQTLKQRLEPELKNAVGSATNGMERQLSNDLSRATGRAARDAGSELEAAMGGAGGRAGRAAGQSFGNTFGNELVGAVGRLANLASVIDIMGPGIANLVAGLSSAVSGLFAMGAAASQAAGALAVLPGLYSVVGQAFGAVKLAFGGIGQALKLGTKAQTAAISGGQVASTAAKKATKAATSNTAAQVAAAKRLQKAQDDLKFAQDAARKTQDALNAAQKNAADGADEQATAQKLLAAAQQKRNEVLKDPNASATQGAAAQKGLDAAKSAFDGVVRARADAQDKLRKAAEANDAAQERVRKAQAARDRAQNAKNKNPAGAAVKAGGIQTPAIKAANAYQDALNHLSPAAQAFVKEVLKMRAAFHEVGVAIGNELFPRLTKALVLIGNSRFFDILKKNLSETGKIIGNMGLNLAQAFTTPKSMNAFDKILKGNNGILKVFNTSMKDLGGNAHDSSTPIDHFVSLVLKLLQAIQPITKRFVVWGVKMLAAADASAKLGNKTSGLLGFFKKAGDRAAQLGHIFHNLVGIIMGLGKAALPAGDGLLKTFDKATGKLDKFINKPKQQKELTKFFNKAATNFRALSKLIGNISFALLSLGDNPGVKKMADGLEPAVKNFKELGDKLTSGSVGKALGDFGTAVSQLMLDLTQTGQTKVFLKTLGTIVRGLDLLVKGFNKIPFAGTILGFVAVNRAIGFSAKLLGFSKTWGLLKKNLIGVAGSGLKKIGGYLGDIGKKIPGMSKISNAFKKLGDTKVGEKVKKIVGRKAPADETGDARARGVSVGHAIADGIAEGIGEHSALVITAVDEMVDELITAIKHRLGIASPSRVTTVIGEQTGEGFVQGVRAEAANAFKAGEQLAEAAAAGASSGKGATAVASAVPAVGVGPAKGLDGGEKKVGRLAGSFGKLGGAAGRVGGSFRLLGGGITALLGGPFGILLLAIPLVIKGFQELYKHSPAFRKFVDGIVKALKPIIHFLGTIILKVLNAFFGWVNKNLPKLGHVFGSVFHAVGNAIGWVIDFAKKHWPLLLGILLGPIGFIAGMIIKHWGSIKKGAQALWGKIRDVASSIAGKFGDLKKKIGDVVAGIVKRFNDFKKKMGDLRNWIGSKVTDLKNAWQSFQNKIGDVVAGIKGRFNDFKENLGNLWGKIKGIVGDIKSKFGEIKDSVSNAFSGLMGKAAGPINSFIRFLNKYLIGGINKITGKFGLTIGNIPTIQGHADGGRINGRGGPREDNQLRRLSVGEYVVKEKSARAIGYDALEYANRTGRMPSSKDFGTGGFGWPHWAPDLGLGKLQSLAGKTVGGIVNIGEKIAKEGLGKVLKALVGGAEGLMGTVGIKRGPFINDFFYGIMDKLGSFAEHWGRKSGHQSGGTLSRYSSSKWVLPFAGVPPMITQFANQGHNPPWAIDFGMPSGTHVRAATSGVVALARSLGDRSYGNYMVLQHAHGIKTLYAHLTTFLKKAGDHVATGDTIAYSGSTGHSTGPHLHFEIIPSHDTLEELRKRGIKLAKGGIVKATDGGVHALIGEAGKNERVEPLDNRGMSKRDKEMLRLMRGGIGKGDLNVNIYNPAPERASTSTTKAIRSKAISNGWI